MDLGGVTRINSCGVREWINFIERLKPGRLVFERCSVPFVNQLNLISNFSGGARIASVYTPYFCDTCDEERTHLVNLEQGVNQIEETRSCPVCSQPMVFDDLPDQFLSFAKSSSA
jgi:hypothetical protein